MLRAVGRLDLGPIIAFQHLLLLCLELRGIVREFLHDLLFLTGAVSLVLRLLTKAWRSRIWWLLALGPFLLDRLRPLNRRVAARFIRVLLRALPLRVLAGTMGEASVAILF